MDFVQAKALKAECKQGFSSDKGLKIKLEDSRGKNSGWLPTKPLYVNEKINCLSDLGRIFIHRSGDVPFNFRNLVHGFLYSFVITPKIIQSDESIRRIAPNQ